ncbi:filamentous hemagglutinin N-terminal domain-containing protein [Nostoc sp. CHAB 5784]|uniref:two-partner secretion domain-containing protein n=1 Tax=Nostoc mirabile TaxID=2907820 RepID=UPI001E2945CE|nr:filamentous hemagglutinin N-terminal domain-containing protein [Nostoc mirabile]MCC5669236.1 filamentous hemagglutinin N-terminal domain-containing protein [Nostoc mirabile CHAB5784]
MLKIVNIPRQYSWYLKIYIILFFSNIFTYFLTDFHPANAQIIPDNTLGTEKSTITPQNLRELIGGGAIRGGNLFHSFQEFNVNQGQQVYFTNPAGISNILTRVTGNHISKILGTLGIDGAANLFLINPNGIVFGKNVRLDIAGSFVASTANAIKLGNNGLFSATEPQNSNLLTIQPTVLFANALHQQQAEISVEGNLTIGSRQTLTLQGEIVTNTGSLTVPGGTVQILGNQVSLLNNATINIDALNNGNGGTVIIKANDLTRFEGNISARGGDNSGNGGFVEVSGGRVEFAGTVDTSAANGFGTLLLDPKDILIQAGGTVSGQSLSQALALNNVSLQANNDITVDDDITGVGANNLNLEAGRSLTINPNRSIILNGGNFNAKINDENAIATQRDPGVAQFFMNPGSQILTNSGNATITSGKFGQTSQINTTDASIISAKSSGNGGDIALNAINDITTGNLISGFFNIPNTTDSINSGDITINSSAGGITTTNYLLANAQQQAGDISLLAAGNLSLNAAGDFPRSGNIASIGDTPGKITFTSGNILSGKNIRIVNANLGAGKGNDITLSARSIFLDTTSIFALARGTGKGGNMILNATDDVVMRTSDIGTNSDAALAVNLPTGASGDAGDFTLNARRLSISQDPTAFFPFRATTISTGTDLNTTGNAGNLTINASESVEIIGRQPTTPVLTPSQLVSQLLQGTGVGISTNAFGSGNSGKLTVNTGRLVLRDAGGITTFPVSGNGGDLTINATEILLQNFAGIQTATAGSGQAGDLTINSDKVTLTGRSIINATALAGTGNAGNLTLSVKQLNVRDGSIVSSATTGEGNGATLTLNATDKVEVVGNFIDSSLPSQIATGSLSPIGNAGPLNITTGQLIVRQGGEITSGTVGQGNGAPITINTRTLQLYNGRINASTAGAGNGGDITINANESVEVAGNGFADLQEKIINPAFAGTLSLDNFDQGIVAVSAGQGKAGNVVIQTPNFLTRNSGIIGTTALDQGQGGNITINTSNIFELNNSFIGTGTLTNAESGNVNLTVRQLTAKGGAQVFTTTFGSGKAGDLTVNALESIDLFDPSPQGFGSGLFASSAQTASGKGGDININISNGDLKIRDRATISVSALGTGNAGDVNIDARSIFLDQGSITATSVSGQGGNINLKVANNLLLRNNSQISTRAGTENSGGGNGGNMDINSRFIVAVPQENSDITANAFAGNGGNINITTQGIFGLQVSDELTPNSDITASSQLGINGTININTPDVDPSRGLTQLPSVPTDPANQIVAGCPSNEEANFVISGRGGLPEDPRQVLRGQVVLQDMRVGADSPNKLSGQISNRKVPDIKGQSPLIEATGWIINQQGQVELVSNTHEVKLSYGRNKGDCGN